MKFYLHIIFTENSVFKTVWNEYERAHFLEVVDWFVDFFLWFIGAKMRKLFRDFFVLCILRNV